MGYVGPNEAGDGEILITELILGPGVFPIRVYHKLLLELKLSNPELSYTEEGAATMAMMLWSEQFAEEEGP